MSSPLQGTRNEARRKRGAGSKWRAVLGADAGMLAVGGELQALAKQRLLQAPALASREAVNRPPPTWRPGQCRPSAAGDPPLAGQLQRPGWLPCAPLGAHPRGSRRCPAHALAGSGQLRGGDSDAQAEKQETEVKWRACGKHNGRRQAKAGRQWLAPGGQAGAGRAGAGRAGVSAPARQLARVLQKIMRRLPRACSPWVTCRGGQGGRRAQHRRQLREGRQVGQGFWGEPPNRSTTQQQGG